MKEFIRTTFLPPSFMFSLLQTYLLQVYGNPTLTETQDDPSVSIQNNGPLRRPENFNKF